MCGGEVNKGKGKEGRIKVLQALRHCGDSNPCKGSTSLINCYMGIYSGKIQQSWPLLFPFKILMNGISETDTLFVSRTCTEALMGCPSPYWKEPFGSWKWLDQSLSPFWFFVPPRQQGSITTIMCFASCSFRPLKNRIKSLACVWNTHLCWSGFTYIHVLIYGTEMRASKGPKFRISPQHAWLPFGDILAVERLAVFSLCLSYEVRLVPWMLFHEGRFCSSVLPRRWRVWPFSVPCDATLGCPSWAEGAATLCKLPSQHSRGFVPLYRCPFVPCCCRERSFPGGGWRGQA